LCDAGDLVLAMGAGDIGETAEQLASALAIRADIEAIS